MKNVATDSLHNTCSGLPCKFKFTGRLCESLWEKGRPIHCTIQLIQWTSVLGFERLTHNLTVTLWSCHVPKMVFFSALQNCIYRQTQHLGEHQPLGPCPKYYSVFCCSLTCKLLFPL